jgi:hypothetical protein
MLFKMSWWDKVLGLKIIVICLKAASQELPTNHHLA